MRTPMDKVIRVVAGCAPMTVTKTNVSLSESSREILAQTGNASRYISELVARNWETWHTAYNYLSDAGWTKRELLRGCQLLHLQWRLDDYRIRIARRGRAGGEPISACIRDGKQVDCVEAQAGVALRVLAWEYWHGNVELRTLLE